MSLWTAAGRSLWILTRGTDFQFGNGGVAFSPDGWLLASGALMGQDSAVVGCGVNIGCSAGDWPRTPLMIIWAHRRDPGRGRGLGLSTLLP